MKLPAAVADFESLFSDVSKSSERSQIDLVCSGGVVSHDSVMPALYSSAERAVVSWLSAATSQKPPEHAKLEWFHYPELIEYQITIADRLQQHRLVGNRFAVKSQYKTS